MENRLNGFFLGARQKPLKRFEDRFGDLNHRAEATVLMRSLRVTRMRASNSMALFLLT
jgi:hypothetical protein